MDTLMGRPAKIPLTMIIPVHNRVDKLLRALRSVAAQRDRPAELIIVDDCSTPPVSIPNDMIRDLNIQIVRHLHNRGAAAARNTGMAAAQTDWISFLDSDDYLLPNTLGARWKMVMDDQFKQPSTSLIYGCAWRDVNAYGQVLSTRIPRSASDPTAFASGCWFSPGSCVIMNLRAIRDIGVLQDETLRRFEDFDWFLALALCGMSLKTFSCVAVAVEHRRENRPDMVKSVSICIRDKWERKIQDKNLRSRLYAYLDLECAAANYFAARPLKAAYYLSRSVLSVPRTTLQLSPGWTSASACSHDS